MTKLKIKFWDECPIGIYRRLVDVSTDPALSDDETMVAKTAILCDNKLCHISFHFAGILADFYLIAFHVLVNITT